MSRDAISARGRKAGGSLPKYEKSELLELVSTIRLAPQKFDVLIGAGLSKTAGIPLAGELVELIKTRYRRRIDALPKGSQNDYGACMNTLSIDERHDLLRPYLEESHINWAHIALACMQKRNHVRRVLTFNFDNVLARACGLLGLYPATYDFGIAPADNMDFLSDPCIIHLHGQGVGPVMKNSTKETEEHAERLKPLIVETYNKSNLLVIGYSGEADQVFPLLKRCYGGRRHIYWIGYSETPKPHIKELLESDHGRYCHYLGGADADTFMIELAQELGCFPPEIFADPASHLKAELTEVTPFPLEKTSLKKDLLKDTIERLDRHRDELRFTAEQNAVAEGRPEDLLDSETSIEASEGLSADDRQLHAWAHFSKAYQIIEKAEETNDPGLFSLGAEQYEKAVRLNPAFPEAFNNWGNALYKLAIINRDEDLFRSAFDKYQRSFALNPEDPELFNNWGSALFELANIKQDEELLQSALTKYQRSFEIKPDNADLLYNWGSALSDLAMTKKDEDLFRSAFDKYQQSYALQPNDADLLNNWGSALFDLARIIEDEDLVQSALEKYQKSYELKPDDAALLKNWGNVLSISGQIKKEEKLLYSALEKYQKSYEQRPDDATLLKNWGNALSILGQLKHEGELFQSALEKYQKSYDLKPEDAGLLNGWGSALSILGQIKHDEAMLQHAVSLLDHAVELEPEKTYNRACIRALIGNPQGCREDLENALAAGTLPRTDHMLLDEDLQSVKSETWFKTILEQNRSNVKH
jgi:tetratricopeptide (TPR) repeat protein